MYVISLAFLGSHLFSQQKKKKRKKKEEVIIDCF